MDLPINILTAAALAAAFPLGFLLYEWSKDEVDAVAKKFQVLKQANKILLPLSAIAGMLAAWLSTEIVIIIFAVNLLAASFGVRSWKESARPALGFVVLFLGIKYILLTK